MMDPKIIAGEQPTADYHWCDECLRWEHVANTTREKLLPPPSAARCFRVAEFLQDLAVFFENLGDIVMVSMNLRDGKIVESPPKDSLQ